LGKNRLNPRVRFGQALRRELGSAWCLQRG
jgi:hypothetical protein